MVFRADEASKPINAALSRDASRVLLRYFGEPKTCHRFFCTAVCAIPWLTRYLASILLQLWLKVTMQFAGGVLFHRHK